MANEWLPSWLVVVGVDYVGSRILLKFAPQVQLKVMRIAFIVVVAMLVAGLVGFAVGYRLASKPALAPELAFRGSDWPAASATESATDPGPDEFARYARQGDWGRLVDRLLGLQHTHPALAASERLRLLGLAAQLGRDGKSSDAVLLMSSYVARDPSDTPAQFLLAQLYQLNGRPRDALEPLFVVLDFPPDQASKQSARRELDLLINGIVQSLVSVVDIHALVDLYRGLVSREPGFDKHRLGLIRWLVRSDQYPEAQVELAELGTVGISADEVDAVRSELRIARSELPVVRQGHMLYADPYISGVRVRMLVDTGASRTGLRSEVLRGLGSIDLGRSLRVRTAGGLVNARLHRVSDLVLGELQIEELEVLAIDTLPGGVEGLLGMDVLSGYPSLDL
jgi:predicted aspartyl protease